MTKFLGTSEIILSIFCQLDIKSLLETSLVCSRWHEIHDKYQNAIWSSLARRDFGIKELPKEHRNWKEIYIIHFNIQYAKFEFADSINNFKLPHSTDRRKSPRGPSKCLFTWASDPLSVYQTSVDQNRTLCWVDPNNQKQINLADLSTLCQSQQNSRGSKSISDNQISAQYCLSGHKTTIGLLLGNNEGTLYSFDESAMVLVWDLESRKLERAIDTSSRMGSIQSMNVWKRRIVTGGVLGEIVVWDADTGLEIFSVFVPLAFMDQISLPFALNVAICDDYVVICLFDGTISVYSIQQNRIIRFFSVVDAVIYQQAAKNALESSENSLAALNNPSAYSLYTSITTESLTYTGIKGPVSKQQHLDLLKRRPLVTPGQEWMVPATLSLNEHVLITNGAYWDEIIIWDVHNGTFLYTLSESISLHRNNNITFVPFRELKFAEMSLADGGSMVYGSVTYADVDVHNLLLWDFSQNILNTRHFEKYRLLSTQDEPENSASLDTWICFELE